MTGNEKVKPARGPGRPWTVKCPICGHKIAVQGIGGRNPVGIPVIFLCDTLQATGSVTACVKELARLDIHCSRAYVYNILKQNNLTAKGVLAGERGA